MSTKVRIIPNPKSDLLSNAVVGGVGLSLPPDYDPPPGMAVVLLYVPVEHMSGKSPLEIQEDLGLPWFAEDGAPVWFDEF